MANEYKLSYTAEEIDNKLSEISQLSGEISQLSSEIDKKIDVDQLSANNITTALGYIPADSSSVPSNTETWVFTLEDGSTVSKVVYVG